MKTQKHGFEDMLAGPEQWSTRICVGKRIGSLALLLVILLLSACATTDTPGTESIAERAQARWDALLSGDLETAYSYYSPGYRSTTSVIDFGVELRTRRVRWTSAEYREHSCEPNRCSVAFDIGFLVPKAVPGVDEFKGKSVIEETWIKSAGEWWFLPEKR